MNAKNLIYISYGMPRSGSTFLYQITKSVIDGFKAKGYFQGDSRQAFEIAEIKWHEELFVNDENDLLAIVTKLEKINLNLPFAFVIKTHCFPSLIVDKILTMPSVKFNCIWRDPIEVAKSVFAISMDEYLSEEKKHRFDKYGSILDTVDGVLQNCNAFLWWASRKNALSVSFNHLVTNPEIVTKAICDQISAAEVIDFNYISQWYFQDKINRIGEYRINGGGGLRISESELNALENAFKDIREKLKDYSRIL